MTTHASDTKPIPSRRDPEARKASFRTRRNGIRPRNRLWTDPRRTPGRRDRFNFQTVKDDSVVDRHCDRDRGESHDSSPPTPPYIRVRIRRFDRLSTVGVSRRAGESDSGVRRHGFGPFERRIRASPFLIAAKASGLDIRPHGRFEVSTSKRPSIVQAFSETRSAYYAFC